MRLWVHEKSCHQSALVRVDPSPKPGGVEQMREKTAGRSKVLIGAAERMIFQRKKASGAFVSFVL